MAKSFFIDTTKCTACRGCQIACKEWKGLPATQTKQRGSHQNPEDLNGKTLKLVRFSDHIVDGKIIWNFFSDQCRHCIEPPCKIGADGIVEGAVVIDEKTGAVIYTDKIKDIPADAAKEFRFFCPYDIPRLDADTGLITKCNMCIDRVSNGMLPMCAKACPTGAIRFGEREEMLALAEKRLAEVSKEYSKASLLNKNDVRVVYLIVHESKLYHEYACGVAKENRSFA